MFKRLIALILTTGLLLAASPATAALNAYMTVKGQKSGQIKGSVTQKGREDSIMVIAYEHQLTAPVDVKSGQATGKRQHGVFKFTKELDRSSPQLINAWVTGEVLQEVVIRFYSPQVKAGLGAGGEYNQYTVKLTNARIVGIRSYMLNNKNPELTRYESAEELTLVYDTIEWTWNDGGITATDTWAGR